MKAKSLSTPYQRHLIEKHTPLVKKIAARMAHGLSANVEYDDLVQDGMLGLMDAILRSTKAAAGAQFESYVAQRARGAMLDGLRAFDPAGRQIRRDMRQVERTIHSLGHLLGRAPLESEVAAALDLTLADYQHLLQEAHGYTLISLDDLTDEDNPQAYLELCASSHAAPLAALERESLRQALIAAITVLPAQEKFMLNLYYEEGLKMHEIGATMGLSESRVSQIHRQAIALLRASFVGSEPNSSLLKPRREVR